MLSKQDITRIVGDFFKTQAARVQQDALAVFDTNVSDELLKLPPQVTAQAFEKIAVFFGYENRAFTSITQVVDCAYSSFSKCGQITFLTSGSTGISKPCVHPLSMLVEESDGLKPLFSGVRRVVSFVPSSHLYGFTFTVMLPHVLDVPVVCLPALPSQNWDALLQTGDLLVGFPLFWQYLLKSGTSFKPGLHALSATAPCKDEIIRGLFQSGISRFTEIYGASETGVIGARHQAGEAFSLMPFWQLSADKTKLKRLSQSAWISIPDNVAFSQDGKKLRPLGRKDACVQVAGLNVFPKHVEKVLSSHPAVQACRVRLMRPEEGTRLKAFVVLKEGFSAEIVSQLRAYLQTRLTVHEMPRTFTFGARLPYAALGKACDW